jgi:ABC-type nitrate/sulfonate/bicarbonate transport system substrate-binding protein
MAFGLLAALAGMTPSRIVGAEEPVVRVALPGIGPRLVPIHLLSERRPGDDGPRVEIIVFRGEPAAAQALAARSVDVALLTLNGLVRMVLASHPVRAFYPMTYRPDYEWFAKPGITDWAQLRGKTIAVTTVGGLTELLTARVLEGHGLRPGRDAQIVATGDGPTRLAALRSGRVDAAVLQSPFRWEAQTAGFARLGGQATELTDEWVDVFVAREEVLTGRPAVLRGLLQAYVRAVRHVTGHREETIRTLMEWLKYRREHAERGYDEIVRPLDGGGRLSARALAAFWEIAKGTGEATETLPEARYLDRRFMDTLHEWMPR